MFLCINLLGWKIFIQSKRALRALKALVKLQALVRGHLVRKQTAYALRRLQALVRAQVRARAGRGFSSESPHSSIKSSHVSYPVRDILLSFFILAILISLKLYTH